MAAENILGKLIIEGANRAGGIAGGAPSLGSGLAGGGGGGGTRSAEQETRSFQKTVKNAQVKAVGFAKEQPKWWTRMFKTLGIQMGLAGILKQSQVFTSTIGAMFQIFGAMVDVMLVPLVKPVLMPVMRWLARQIPTMGRLSKAVFGFIGSTVMNVIGWIKKIGGWASKGWDGIIAVKNKLGDILGWLKNLASATWWGNALSTVGSNIVEAIMNSFNTLFTWSVFTSIKERLEWPHLWSIFRNLWESTLGDKTMGKGPFKFTFPSWTGGSTYQDEDGSKPGPPTAQQKVTSAILDRAMDEGNFGSSYAGTPATTPNRIFDVHTSDDEGGAFGPSAYETPQSGATPSKGKSWLEKIKGTPADLVDMFQALGSNIKHTLAILGIVASPIALAKLTARVKGAAGLVIKGGLAPSNVAFGIIRGMVQQLNPLAQESVIGQIFKGQGKNALSEAMGNWTAGMKKDLGFGQAPPDFAQMNRNYEAGPGGRIQPKPKASGLVDRYGNPIASSSVGPDVVPERSASKLVRAKKLVEEFTAWVLRKLRNIGSIIKNPQAVKVARDTAARMLKNIEDLLRPIMNQVGAGATEVADAQRLLAAARVSKSFLLRAMPLVGAAVGLAETAYNINQIARSDLSWVKPKESEELTRDMERMKSTLGMSGDLFSESAGYGFGMGDWFGAKKLMTAMGGADVAETGLYQGAGTPLMHTKTGAILTQLLLGGVTTAAGGLGVAGMPFSLPAAMAQEVHRMGVMGGDSQNIMDSMIQAFNTGVLNKEKTFKIQLDGIDASMSMPGYL